jgi:hypothetical protein
MLLEAANEQEIEEQRTMSSENLIVFECEYQQLMKMSGKMDAQSTQCVKQYLEEMMRDWKGMSASERQEAIKFIRERNGVADSLNTLKTLTLVGGHFADPVSGKMLSMTEKVNLPKVEMVSAKRADGTEYSYLEFFPAGQDRCHGITPSGKSFEKH